MQKMQEKLASALMEKMSVMVTNKMAPMCTIIQKLITKMDIQAASPQFGSQTAPSGQTRNNGSAMLHCQKSVDESMGPSSQKTPEDDDKGKEAMIQRITKQNTVASSKMVKGQDIPAIERVTETTPNRRIIVKALDTNAQYKLFLKNVFCVGIPPLLVYDRAVRHGTKMYKLLIQYDATRVPEDGEHWVLLKNKTELTPVHRPNVRNWESYIHDGRNAIICMREYFRQHKLEGPIVIHI